MKWIALIIFPPLATTIPTVQQLTHNNRWPTVVLILLYELAVGIVYLFTKIWQRLEDPWTKQIADTIDQRVQMALSRYHHYYCHFFRYVHQDLDVKEISLFLREHSPTIAEKGTEYSLVQAVRTQVRAWQWPMPDGWIERQLKRGHCLILLDGLDEVADSNYRQKVGQWVEQQMVSYAGNRFVLTSRPYGYRRNVLSGVTALEVQPFTFEQIL